MKFLIIANGPFLSKDIIHEAAKTSDVVIALDGASTKVAKAGIMPHVILGDFDSVNEAGLNFWGIKKTFNQIDENSESYLGHYGVKIVPAKNQDLTDLAKAIQYCDKNGATAIDIVCAIGGDRIDHTISNMRILRVAHKPNRTIRLLTEGQVLTFAANQRVLMKGEINDYCGIIAAPVGSFTSEGLAYNGKDYELTFGFAESTANQLTHSIAIIDVVGEAIIIHPAQLSSQRKFLAMNYSQRLSQLHNEQQVKLHETTAGELRHARVVRRIIKEKLNIQSQKTDFISNKKGAVVYLSHKKSDIFDEKKLASDEKILISVPDKKFTSFNLFKELKIEDVRKKSMSELMLMMEDIDPDRISDCYTDRF